MFKKFNWGWGIALFYTGFVVFMLFMVWCTNLMKTELVTEDYYGKELKFQEQLDKMKRSNVLSQPVNWTVLNNSVKLNFPVDVKGKDVKAKVLFYRPDNSLRDFNVNCQVDSTGVCIINSDKFHHGAYKMEVDWSAGKETYYTEGVININ
jgi:nitrogen fixation protein FixH